jgi:pyruvate dehydrogenase E1 component
MGEAARGEHRPPAERRSPRIGALKAFRDRFNIPISRRQDREAAVLQAARRRQPGDEVPAGAPRRAGRLPAGAPRAARRSVPPLDAFETRVLEGSGEGREISTTMAFVRMLTRCCATRNIGKRIVPIVPDEARTFGMEGCSARSASTRGGPALQPVRRRPADVLQARIQGRPDSRRRASTKPARCRRSSPRRPPTATTACHDPVLHLLFDVRLPARRRFAWAAGDMRARGFLLGGTAGRTTLSGEGLQHQDGHSHSRLAPSPTASPTTRPSPTRWR